MITSNMFEEKIPEECNFTIDHAMIHLKSASESEAEGDRGQVYHDLYLVARITAEIFNRIEKEMSPAT